MQLFFLPRIEGDNIILDEPESNHCVRVLRLSAGSRIQLVDGAGGFYTAEITDPHPKKCRLRIISSEKEFGKRNFYLHIAIAPTKNIERFEWFLEKATEIGIDEITPLLCRFSERKEVKTERLNKILVSAMKQSVKAYLPKLNEMQTFSEIVAAHSGYRKFIAHCYEGEKLVFKNAVIPGEKILILIGPEGDFSEEEVAKARQEGFLEITLGQSRLRTETAGVVACHTINLINE